MNDTVERVASAIASVGLAQPGVGDPACVTVTPEDLARAAIAAMPSPWQDIKEPPTHRNDVLILSADGHVGIGWFSQMEDGPKLNIEYIARGDMKPTLDGEVAARRITHHMPLPKPPVAREG